MKSGGGCSGRAGTPSRRRLTHRLLPGCAKVQPVRGGTRCRGFLPADGEPAGDPPRAGHRGDLPRLGRFPAVDARVRAFSASGSSSLGLAVGSAPAVLTLVACVLFLCAVRWSGPQRRR